MDRREFLKAGLSATLVLPVAGALLATRAARAADDDKLITELEEMKVTVGALQYVNESAKPDQDCANCQFFTATSGGRGKCQLFMKGVVSEKGWCMSWVKKAT